MDPEKTGFVSKKVVFDEGLKSPALRERLYKLYETDFNLFGYDKDLFY